MKILTILGTRPEIIRLSLIIKKLDQVCDHRVLHTGQNYDKSLNDIFFNELNLRKPDIVLMSKGSLANQVSSIFLGVEKELIENKPDKVLLLGDTNSGLASIIVERFGIPVYHMEAGNRCFDLKVPEERNRKIIDHTCSFNLVYTPGARENLLSEGIPKSKIFFCGNPIKEVIDERIIASNLRLLNMSKRKNTTIGFPRDTYIIATIHRSENVDNESRLRNIIDGLSKLDKLVVLSCHPKTKDRLNQFNIDYSKITLIEPVGLDDFIGLEMNAYCIITDSGTVMEEACILNKKCLVVRDSTERPEVFENGNVVLCGTNSGDILNSYNSIKKISVTASLPVGYEKQNVSDLVVNFMMGKGV